VLTVPHFTHYCKRVRRCSAAVYHNALYGINLTLAQKQNVTAKVTEAANSDKEGQMTIGRDIEFKVGRRSFDGTIRLSPHPPQLLQLSVSYKGERSSSVMLTRDQIQTLQQALANFEQALSGPNGDAEIWDHNERRANTYWSSDSSTPVV
jgi:hypothetical protein